MMAPGESTLATLVRQATKLPARRPWSAAYPGTLATVCAAPVAASRSDKVLPPLAPDIRMRRREPANPCNQTKSPVTGTSRRSPLGKATRRTANRGGVPDATR